MPAPIGAFTSPLLETHWQNDNGTAKNWQDRIEILIQFGKPELGSIAVNAVAALIVLAVFEIFLSEPMLKRAVIF